MLGGTSWLTNYINGLGKRRLRDTHYGIDIIRSGQNEHAAGDINTTKHAGEPRRQSRSAFKRTCATAAWPDALQ
jgi:hypothetical protein